MFSNCMYDPAVRGHGSHGPLHLTVSVRNDGEDLRLLQTCDRQGKAGGQNLEL